MKDKISFSKVNPEFTATLRKSVEAYFAENNITLKGNYKIYIKTVVLYTTAIALYGLLMFVGMPVWLAMILCALMGANLAAIGFNVMHDGAHGSYSNKPWVNSIMANTLNMMGGNTYIWIQKHNINHHSFTNVEGHDDDIDIQPWIRTNPSQKKHWFHAYQHFYWVFFYGMSYLSWIFNKDFVKYFTGKVAETKMKKMDLGDHFVFWISKIVYFGVFLVLPIMQLGFVETLIGYLVITYVCGMILSIVFQLAHVVEDASFPNANMDTQKVEQEWTIHQLETTANFGTKSKVLSWFVGGLNFQIEHHLFPKISHIHYPEVSKVVKEVCKQFNVKYIEYPSFLSALRSHIAYLKLAGVQ